MKRVIRGSVTSSKTASDYNYAIQYFQVFRNPKKPTDKGKMIAQAGTFEEAHQKGKKLAGENNYFLKAVCNDGKVRYIDNNYSGPLIMESVQSISSASRVSAADKDAVVEFAKDCKEFGYPVEDYTEFSKILRDQGMIPDKALYQIYVDAYNDEDDIEASEAVDNSEREFQRIDRSGTDEEYKLAAVMYNLGATMNEAREILPTLSEDKIQEYVDYYNLRHLPRSERVKIWDKRKVTSATDSESSKIKINRVATFEI